jgi:hypothetical protein
MYNGGSRIITSKTGNTEPEGSKGNEAREYAEADNASQSFFFYSSLYLPFIFAHPKSDFDQCLASTQLLCEKVPCQALQPPNAIWIKANTKFSVAASGQLAVLYVGRRMA